MRGPLLEATSVRQRCRSLIDCVLSSVDHGRRDTSCRNCGRSANQVVASAVRDTPAGRVRHCGGGRRWSEVRSLGGGAGMLDVFIDRACPLGTEPRVRALNPCGVDVSDERTWSQLEDGGVVLVCVNPGDADAKLACLRTLRRANPHVLVILCVERRWLSRVPLARWVRAGIDELVAIGTEHDVAELLRAVAVWRAAPPPVQELRLLNGRWAPSVARAAALHALRNARSDLRAPELARQFGYSPRTLRELLQDAGLPGPRDLCRCGVMLKLVELIERGVDAPRELASRMGFEDTTEMRKARSRFRHKITDSREGALGTFVTQLPRLAHFVGWEAGTRSRPLTR